MNAIVTPANPHAKNCKLIAFIVYFLNQQMRVMNLQELPKSSTNLNLSFNLLCKAKLP